MTRCRKLREVVNHALRVGLQPTPRRRPATFRTASFESGRCLADIDCVSEALAIGEGEAFR